MTWQPTASVETLKKRAEFNAQIRQFFAHRNVMEVETPVLSNGTVTDVHLDAFAAEFAHSSNGKSSMLYLQTSPEFAMKRLLAADCGAIYQITKAFRNESGGRIHNPEFTMLEWYRPNFNDHDLMAEIDELMQQLLLCGPAIKLSYQQAFEIHLGVDPLTTSLEDLKALVLSFSNDQWLKETTDKDVLLQWLFSMKVEPNLGANDLEINNLESSTEYLPCFVYDFPASQAALARINQEDDRVAHRFELYFKGLELANGYYELQDPQEHYQRFEQDNLSRIANGLVAKPIDTNFIDALNSGLPDCSGVALGLDRLFMLQQNLTCIEQAISFTVNNA